MYWYRLQIKWEIKKKTKTNINATIEELLDAEFCMRSVPRPTLDFYWNESRRFILPRMPCFLILLIYFRYRFLLVLSITISVIELDISVSFKLPACLVKLTLFCDETIAWPYRKRTTPKNDNISYIHITEQNSNRRSQSFSGQRPHAPHNSTIRWFLLLHVAGELLQPVWQQGY
jgi:hypothetical protein